MTAQQLIEALQSMPPGKPVEVLIDGISIDVFGDGEEVYFEIDDEFSAPVKTLEDLGAFVLLRG